MGPYCRQNPSGAGWARALAYLPNNKPSITLSDYNIAWDHTCNLVVTTPDEGNIIGIFNVNQVSEYDGAQRFQPTYILQDGWRKIRGPGGLDFGNYQSSWVLGKELNCGDLCLFYTLEEFVNSDELLPRYFVGRSYRTGNVQVNVTDSVQVQSLSWNPYNGYNTYHVNQFLGIGQCCLEAWCHSDCSNYGENLVFISYVNGQGFSILADIGEMDTKTIELGVEFSGVTGGYYVAYVFHGNTVISYNLFLDNGVIVKATRSFQSPPITQIGVKIWANSLWDP